ncbi:DUF1080 domain-containing protein [Bremerella cremea]|uniref:DUF1080 domain-containing protein n=1 Tax=Bremerella cremea TaxID=1031537 RepID=A0A368KMM2_9BACT|nr:family 43 glycosylhydrolase [Bremerella cremea]RCS43908.1 DUF1080 domain-containing protein [Bremerella cremea]
MRLRFLLASSLVPSWVTVVLWLLVCLCLATAANAEEHETTFVNPVYAAQDPYLMVGPDGAYYQAASLKSDRAIAVYRSESLTDRGIHRVVFTAPDKGPYRDQLWAPEIHYLDGKWWIYTCADDGDNANHRVIVLEAETDDPLGSYKIAAELKTPAWAIDATVSKFPNGKRYCVWSGWPEGTRPDSTQHLFISEMESPTKLTGPIVDISSKMYPWETVGRPDGLNEGAQLIHRNGKTILLYAASGSWTPDYCFGLMTLEGENPLDASAWVKQATPWFSRSKDVYGPGHGCLISSPDGSEDWLVFHSSIDPQGSWNRCINLKKVEWNDDGMPVAGQPTSWGVPVPVPAGEPALKPGPNLSEAFDTLDRWELLHFYNGQTLKLADKQLRINASADRRFGDKVLLRGFEYRNLDVHTRVRFDSEEGTAGIVFRVANAGIGRDNFQGYAAQITSSGQLVLAKCDGQKMSVLASTQVPFAPQRWYDLRVVAEGETLKVYLDGAESPQLTANDASYGSGQVGLRALEGKVTFAHFSIEH